MTFQVKFESETEQSDKSALDSLKDKRQEAVQRRKRLEQQQKTLDGVVNSLINTKSSSPAGISSLLANEGFEGLAKFLKFYGDQLAEYHKEQREVDEILKANCLKSCRLNFFSIMLMLHLEAQ